MPLAAALQAFVDDELARMPVLIEQVLRQTVEALRQAPQGSLSAADRLQRFELAQTLQIQARRFADAFVAALAQRSRGDDTAAMPAAPARGLALLDESAHLADIEIARVASQIDGAAEWELRELQTFTSALCGLPYVSVSTLALRPDAFANALWQAGCTIGSTPDAMLLLRHAGAPLAEALKREFAAACSRLEAQGVQPSLYRTAVPPPEATRSSLLADLLDDATPPPSCRASAQRAPAAVDAQTRDLLRDLFDAIVQSGQMHPALRALTASLQASAFELAAREPQLLESADHPLWLLLDRFAYQSATHPESADPQLRAWIGYATELVATVQRAPLQGGELYRDGVAQLDAYAAAQFNAQVQQAAGDIGALARNAPMSITMDLGTMETVPADLLVTPAERTDDGDPAPGADNDAAAAAWLDAQRPGAWYRMFLRGRWSVMRLLWCSASRTRWLFASPHPQRNAAFEHATLRRLRAQALVRPLVERAVVVRAAESVRRRLADKRTR